ncbi:helix-turn-helix domain-containing protein [Enterococcus sp. LJL90]
MKINGKVIASKRKELRMTQKELADGICNQATISVIENKNMDLSQYLGHDLRDFLEIPRSDCFIVSLSHQTQPV